MPDSYSLYFFAFCDVKPCSTRRGFINFKMLSSIQEKHYANWDNECIHAQYVLTYWDNWSMGNNHCFLQILNLVGRLFCLPALLGFATCTWWVWIPTTHLYTHTYVFMEDWTGDISSQDPGKALLQTVSRFVDLLMPIKGRCLIQINSGVRRSRAVIVFGMVPSVNWRTITGVWVWTTIVKDRKPNKTVPIEYFGGDFTPSWVNLEQQQRVG